MFDKEIYIQRRKILIEKIGSGVVLLLGNDESPMNYADNGYHFRQDSSFLYYFGIDFPGLAGLIDVDNQKQLIFGDDYTIDDIVWMGSQQTIAEKAATGGIADSLPLSELSKVLKAAQQKGREIHFLPPYRPENKLKIQQLISLHPDEISSKSSVKLIRTVVGQREIKSSEEIIEIEHGVNLSVDMHIAAMQLIRPGMIEAQIAARVYEIALAADCELSFPIIATINGQTLHNHSHGNVLKRGDLFLLDAGAETQMHYAGDLSSTFPVDVTFNNQQKAVYEMSLKAHQAAIDQLAPGIPFLQAHMAACHSVAESMKELGLMKGSIEDAVEAGAHALFFPCGTGHMMGLDVHDMEDLGEIWVGYDGKPKSTQFGLKSLRLAKTLKPGHVFTIEPGIYFIPELMDKWQSEGCFNDYINWTEVQKFRNFGGIRNEEDFTITETGVQRLGKMKPKTEDEVDSVRNLQV
jgi:Xaa-Pro aminopeptidase